MSLAQRFLSIHDTNLWGAESSVSGPGPEASATAALSRELPTLLRKFGVTTLLDAPCGDAGWIAGLDLHGIRYTGVDIVADLVARNIAKHQTLGSFLAKDIVRDTLPPSDAILCRDCLVHLSFDHIAAAVANFRRSGARWLLTTTFPGLEYNHDCEDGDWRALSLEISPFAWPAPIELLNERCQEAGGGWRDKSLGLWELSGLLGG